MQVLSYQTLVQVKGMKGKTTAFCFQHFAVGSFEYLLLLFPPICHPKRNTENPEDPYVRTCNILDKLQPSMCADKEATCLLAFEGFFYCDNSNVSQKLWIFCLSAIMKFL